MVAKINIWMEKGVRRHTEKTYTIKGNTENKKFICAEDKKENIFRVAKQMSTENQDVIGEKCIRGDDGNLSLDNISKDLAWKQHYERLLNTELPQSQNLPHVDPVAGPAQFITPDDILESLRCMKNKKAAGPSGSVAEMLKAAPDICCKIIVGLTNTIILEGKIPEDWSESIMVTLFKGKGDALDRSGYRGLKLTDHTLRLLKVVKDIIQDAVKINEMQFGLFPGRGTTDAIFVPN